MSRVRKWAPGGRSLWWQVAISSTGDGMFLTAFPLLAASLTRDPGAIAFVTVASRAPWLFFSLPFGAVADRFDRRRLMMTADLVRGLVVAALAALVIAHEAQVWSLYLCAFVLGAAEVLHANSAQALIPALIGHDDLVAFNGSATALQAATETFIGPPIGSALFAVSASVPFVADAVSFGKPFIANPDLPQRFSKGLPILRADVATFYAQGPEGYIDYPSAA